MSELISGKEAFDAAYNGDEAQWRWTGKEVEWRELKAETAFSINELKGGGCEFRLKPSTITINGVELPMPFKPKVGDIAYFLSEGYEDGYSFIDIFDTSPACFGYWKTEEEIKQVVSALRQVFGG